MYYNKEPDSLFSFCGREKRGLRDFAVGSFARTLDLEFTSTCILICNDVVGSTLGPTSRKLLKEMWNIVKKLLALLCAAAFLAATPGAEASPRRIRLIFAGREAIVELYDNAAAASLVKMLPLTLDFEDYGGKERIAYPPEKLSAEGMPDSYAPKAGEMTVYAPWGNIAIFYKDHHSSGGLVPVGRFVSGAEAITVMGEGVRVEEIR